jgi:hypothetical protein
MGLAAILVRTLLILAAGVPGVGMVVIAAGLYDAPEEWFQVKRTSVHKFEWVADLLETHLFGDDR